MPATGGAGLIMISWAALPCHSHGLHQNRTVISRMAFPNPCSEENLAPTIAGEFAWHQADPRQLPGTGLRSFASCRRHGGIASRVLHLGLLAAAAEGASRRQRGARPALDWTIEIVKPPAARPVLVEVRHAFIKQRHARSRWRVWRRDDAHHYFRRVAYSQRLIPWLLLAQIVSESASRLSRLVGERSGCFVSGASTTGSGRRRPPIAAFEAQ